MVVVQNKKILRSLLGFAFFSLLAPHLTNAQISSVWAVGDGEKIFRNDLNHSDKQGNHIWNSEKIKLIGLYNEVLAFQIITEIGNDSVRNVELVLDAPIHRKSGKIIGGSTLKYGPGGSIDLFSQHYLNVKEEESTPPAWFYGSEKAAPEKMTGWIPDALIPSNALPGRGGFPMDVGPLRNQGFWVDIYLPRDKNFPDGVYESKVKIIEEGKVIKEIPLEITLLPEYLKEQNPSTVWVFTSGLQDYYPDMSQEQLDKMIKFMGHRHRIEITGGFKANNSAFNKKVMEEYRPYLDGSAYSPANGYYGPGQGVGEKLFPIGMYGGNVMGDTKEEVQMQADLWVNWFDENSPKTVYFRYLIDEPTEEKHAWVNERGKWIDSNPGVGKKLPLFTTTHFQQPLEGSIDIWAAFNGVELKDLDASRKNGGDYWFYNGNRPRYGSVILEGEAVDLRVNSWILYKYGINTHFIWHGTHWKHNGQGPKRLLHQNIFENPVSYLGGGSFGNGDGILFYPGHMPYYPNESRGINEIIPSIRLKNIRRGQQDAVIMAMAEEKVGKNKVLKIINKVVPKALSEVSMEEPVPWSEDGDDYEKVREELLKLL